MTVLTSDTSCRFQNYIRFGDALEGITELTEGVTLMVTAYDGKKIWIKISQEKKHMGKNPEKVPNAELLLSSLRGVRTALFPGADIW